ncbi:NFX1-type zinc finger-containing protein 1-like [Phlebotomus papatasi]|uniref:NFX1-type zinc finger-containing protein 1-like n=1 Tax=Phlebotomus papatasi TaxID=29031 RepID=UPI002483FD32|nr:NFX1-type zinc finger-containing protein 1-like [Phlebotomus papatasi]
MNEKQFEAFQLGLTRKLSLIQGPPGTGKSAVALNIVQRILEKTSCTILVVTFQKYNLDKFLMDCSALTEKIVRIGGYLGDSRLERFTLDNTVQDPRIHRIRRQCIAQYENLMNIFADKLKINDRNEDHSHDALMHILNEVQKTSLKGQELHQLHLYKECRGARIIGMTTTGIAKYSCLLKLIRPSVVIMEEAENSPECQVITALTEYTQQLIFVGEAKRIGFLKDLHFDIPCRNTSLFERLVENDINNILLNVQHRMHPNISDLVRETLYPDLIDGDNVKSYQPIRGISKNLFCVVLKGLSPNDDSLLEQFPVQNQEKLSKESFHEILFSCSLANYLRQQGYKAHEIVIFTTGSDNEVEALEAFLVLFPLLKDVRVKSMEKFQGQECRILIVSLATTDQNPNIESMSRDDRLCVLLTRAQEGLYIVGQLDLYVEMNETWRKVKENLESKGCIGPILSIKCEKHGCEILAAGVEDFLKFSQEGCPTGTLDKENPCIESN